MLVPVPVLPYQYCLNVYRVNVVVELFVQAGIPIVRLDCCSLWSLHVAREWTPHTFDLKPLFFQEEHHCCLRAEIHGKYLSVSDI